MRDTAPHRRRFDWHPEPELLDYTDAERARPALERVGADAWNAALDYILDEAMRRPVAPETYLEVRRAVFATDRAADARARGGRSAGPGPAPQTPATAADVLDEFRARLAPYQMNASNPRAFCYFTPPPLVLSILGELLAQAANQGVDLWRTAPSATLVEEEVVAWLRDLVGYGDGSFGILTSGGVMANLMAMAVARDVRLGALANGNSAPEATAGAVPPRGRLLEGARVYASDQAHFSIARALDILGFPAEALRVVPSDDRFRLQARPVADAIRRDRASGLVPFAIAAVAGSTNTGSIDALEDLASLASAESLWLHVDAAYGGAVRLSAGEAHRVTGLQLADSVTIDPHKWFFQAHDIGALLVRRRHDLLSTFHREPEYYRAAVRGDPAARERHDPATEPVDWYQYGLEGTRRFRGLKLWLSWKHLGTEGLGRLVEANLELAAHLAARIADSNDFEALPEEPELSVVCFRHLPLGRSRTHQAVAAGRLEPAALDAHQDRLQRALEVSGEGWVSTTRLRGSTWLRAGIVNYLSTEEDVDAVLEALRRLAADL